MSNSAERPALSQSERESLNRLRAKRYSRLLDTTDYPANIANALYSLRWFNARKLRWALAITVALAPVCIDQAQSKAQVVRGSVVNEIKTETVLGFQNLESGSKLSPHPPR